MFKFHTGLVASFMLLSAPAWSVQAQPTGQINTQIAYVSESVNSRHWLLQMPLSYVGVSAVEALPSGTFMAQWRAGFDPLADDLVLDQQQAFVSWQQSMLTVWAGELISLEAAFIESDPLIVQSIERGGLAVANHILQTENKAVRVDFQSSETLLLAGQLVMDEQQADTTWSLAAVIQSPEGTLASTYRKTEEGYSQWGLKARLISEGTALVGASVFQDQMLAWDLGMQFEGESSVAFFNYGVDGDNNGLWRIGLHQLLTTALLNYSEVVWFDDNEFQWSTGFQLTF